MSRRIRQSRNSGGRFWLVPLPGGLGLNIGPGYSGFSSVRSWEWAKYDHADHMEEENRWVSVNLSKGPHGATPFAQAWDTWQTARHYRRTGGEQYRRYHPESPLRQVSAAYSSARRVAKYWETVHPRDKRRAEATA